MVKIVVIEEETDQFAKKLAQAFDDGLGIRWETKTTTHCKFEEFDSVTSETFLRDSILHSIVLVDYSEEGES